MRILFVHNDYAAPSGEEASVQALAALLQENGHTLEFFRRSSAELIGLGGQIKGFFAGIHNPFAAKALAAKLDDFKPDLVQLQNIYPLLSVAVLKPIVQRRIPLLMRCPNYRLFCPNGLCYRPDGLVCESCFGGREWHCLWHNCAGGALRSLGYALRNWRSRRSKLLLRNVDAYIVQSEFQRQKFIGQGIAADKLHIVPGLMPDIAPPPANWQAGENITFVGRVSPEKGILQFLRCARALPELPFVVAGSYEGMPELLQESPANVSWRGFLSGEELRQAYLQSRLIVVPSQWYEGFPNVIVMGMMLERCIISSDIGATGSIVKDGFNGRLSPTGDSQALAQLILELYNDQRQCRELASKARAEAEKLYSRQQVYETLIGIYKQLIPR